MAFVQATCNSTPTGSGTKHLTQAYGSNVTSGNLLVAFVCGSIATPTISDTIGTSWGSPVTSVDDAGDGERLQCWIGVAPSSAANTVDVTFGSALGDGWIGIAELSGRSGTVTASGTVLMTPTGNPNIFSCPNGSTISIAAHDDVVFAMVETGAFDTNQWSVASGSGFTERCETGGGSNLDGAIHTADDVAVNASYVAQSQAANRNACVGIVLSLAQSGGGGGMTNHMRRIHPF